jgi:phosphoribosylamine--glycine ligase
MGTYSPAPVFTPALEAQVMKEIILPSVQGLKQDGMPYKGVLFAGLMITQQGPKLIEFNARFGDPETQVLMARLKSDLLPLMLAASKGELQGKTVELYHTAALCVVMAAKGYPENYEKGTVIKNLDKAADLPDVVVFHAGTKLTNGQFTANGGRVLGVTATGNTVLEAQKKAYNAVDTIDWKEGFCRRDIGWRAIKRMAS